MHLGALYVCCVCNCVSVYLCMCACTWERCVCVCVCVSVYMCMCACVYSSCASKRTSNGSFFRSVSNRWLICCSSLTRNNTCTHTCIPTHIYTRTHIPTQIYTHTNIDHTYNTHTHIHTRTTPVTVQGAPALTKVEGRRPANASTMQGCCVRLEICLLFCARAGVRIYHDR